MKALNRNKSWTSVPPPKVQNVISRKWVLIKKTNAHGVEVRFHARVVARGFSQILGIGFKDTFAFMVNVLYFR